MKDHGMFAVKCKGRGGGGGLHKTEENGEPLSRTDINFFLPGCCVAIKYFYSNWLIEQFGYTKIRFIK